jgi:hypothetical protein
MLRVIRINPWEKTIVESQIKESLSGIYQGLSHRLIHISSDFNIIRLSEDVNLYVDGEGLLKALPLWSSSVLYGSYLAGIGLIIGHHEDDAASLPELIVPSQLEPLILWHPNIRYSHSVTSTQEVEKFGMKMTKIISTPVFINLEGEEV